MAQSRSVNPSKSQFKRRRPNPTSAESTRITKNPLKKRKRDLTRLLKHAETLPADVRIAHERELASCNADLETADREIRRSQMIKKYHMVRFFERKKATRLLKKARQRLAEFSSLSAVETTTFEKEVHDREVDLNYTLFFPLDEIYTSLYATAVAANKKKSQDDATVTTTPLEDEKVNRADPTWKAVEEAMASGQLQLLREGKLKKPNEMDIATGVKDTTMKSNTELTSVKRKAETQQKPRKTKEEKSHRMQLLERQDLHAKGGARLARRERRAEEREQRRVEAMSSGDEEDGAGFFES